MDVEKLLRKHGPCVSTVLANLLVGEYGATREAARKRISRQQAPVKRLAYLPFPRNARFMYLEEQYGSPRFWEALVAALLETSPAYGGAIAAVRQRDGLLPKDHFLISCGSPLKQKRHLSPQVVLDRLKKANLLEEIDVPGIGVCVARTQEPGFLEDAIPNMQARLVCEDILLKAVRGWARSLGLVSYEKAKVRSDGAGLPQVGTFVWDLSAPSYLGGLVERTAEGRPKPGFVVCDIVLDHEISAQGLAPFLHKCRTLRSLKRVGRCIQIFVAEKYDEDAFRAAKAEGVVPATAETLFGRDVADALRKLSGVLTQAAAVALDPQVFDELFNALGRIEGAATNLRGALFEFWAAELLRQTHADAHIWMNRVFSDGSGKKAEVDVQATTAGNRVLFCECKGYQPGGLLPDEEVDRWLDFKIPLIYGQAKANSEWKSRTFHFEFWTTGRLSDVAIRRITTAMNTIRPGRYTLAYCDAEKLTTMAKDTGNKALLGSLRQHFLDHPMAKIERKQLRQRSKQDKKLLA